MNKATKVGIISALIIASFLIGYVIKNSGSESIQQPSIENWENPTISCVLNEHETPIKQYPYEDDLTNNKKDNLEGLNDFCSRIESKFKNSELSIEEANEIYTIIFNENIVQDGSYGMPGPDIPPRPKLTLEDIKKRVKIRKIDKGKYEIFYKYTNCGTNYAHESIEIQNRQISNRKRIEAWSGSYPC
jgi:hypothetical protein